MKGLGIKEFGTLITGKCLGHSILPTNFGTPLIVQAKFGLGNLAVGMANDGIKITPVKVSNLSNIVAIVGRGKIIVSVFIIPVTPLTVPDMFGPGEMEPMINLAKTGQ